MIWVGCVWFVVAGYCLVLLVCGFWFGGIVVFSWCVLIVFVAVYGIIALLVCGIDCAV